LPALSRAGYERRMLRGELTGLRALTDADIEVFETELLTDVETRLRATGRPWLPVAPGSADSPYRQAQDRDAVVRFSVVELATADLAGEAVMSGIDLHNRRAEIGRLHRIQVTTLADNHAMIAAAVRVGFVLEGTMRETAWINGAFADGVTLSLLFDEWSPSRP
jgi:RimJ/RimL family protein N-acetyltransferase